MLIILTLPPTTNQIYKRGKNSFYKSQAAKDWMEEAFATIKKNVKHERFGTARVEVFIDICWCKREIDIDGCIKPILDILQQTQIIDNDKQIDELHVCKERVKAIPHVKITIQPIIS